MEIKLTPQESEEYFYNALCNAVGTNYMEGYGLEMSFFSRDYLAAKEKLKDPCYENILMQILRDGKKLTFVDNESEGDMTRSITLQDVHDRVQLTPFAHLMNMINENDDAETADVILQTVFFQEIVFG